MNRRWTLLAVEVLTPVLAVLLWYLASADSTSFYFPPLREILSRFNELWLGSGFTRDALPSLGRMVLGYALASVFGITVGVLLGVSRLTQAMFGPLVEFLRSIPSVVLIPFGIVVFGVDTTMKVFVIALGCSFPVILNTIDGVRSVEPLLLDVTRTFRFGRMERLTQVVLPAASPQIFAGLRTSLSQALILMVVSEMVASTNGIGYSILKSQRLFEVADMWAGIVLLGLLGYVINTILVIIEKRVLAWHRGFRASVLGQSVSVKSTGRPGRLFGSRARTAPLASSAAGPNRPTEG
jgi:ABC-type nitrate/sulfonate/bicarbonate transport system permease component